MRPLLLMLFALVSLNVSGQIQVSKLIGKNSDDFKLGYGGFLKFSYPISEASDVTLEAGANVFQVKANEAYGWAVIPIKAGYRYTINRTGEGFYLEPQVGYNVYGIDPDDNNFTGLVLSGGAGYLFPPLGKIQFDLGLLFESAFHKGRSANYASLRLTHNFSLGRRDDGYY
jgi:outer membrane autotransporter protein